MDPVLDRNTEIEHDRCSFLEVLSPLVLSKNNSNPCAKATWTAEGFRVATVVRFLLGGQCANKSLAAPFCTPCCMPFWPNLDPPRVPFWNFLIFGGHPKIVILRTVST